MASRSTLVNIAYTEAAFGLANVAFGVCLYLRRRHLFPIHARHVPLVVLSVLVSVGEAYLHMYITFNELYCTWLRIVAISLSNSRITNITLRYLRLYYHFSRAQDGLRLHQRDNWTFGLMKPAYKKRRGFRWLQKFSSDAFITKLWIGLSLGYFAVLLSIYVAFSSIETYPESLNYCLPIQPARITAITTSSLLAVEAAAVLISLRHLRDNYGIKQELRAFIGMSLLSIVINYVLSGSVLTQNGTELVLWVVFQMFAWVALHYPVYLSFREERRRVKSLSINSSTRELDLTVEQVLNDDQYEEFRESFESFLVREFSMENLIFYKVSREYEAAADDMSDTDVAIAALQVLVEFVWEGAMFQVNLPSKDREKVITDLDACFESLPDACEAYIRDSRANKVKAELKSKVGYEPSAHFAEPSFQAPSVNRPSAMELSSKRTTPRSSMPLHTTLPGLESSTSKDSKGSRPSQSDSRPSKATTNNARASASSLKSDSILQRTNDAEKTHSVDHQSQAVKLNRKESRSEMSTGDTLSVAVPESSKTTHCFERTRRKSTGVSSPTHSPRTGSRRRHSTEPVRSAARSVTEPAQSSSRKELLGSPRNAAKLSISVEGPITGSRDKCSNLRKSSSWANIDASLIPRARPDRGVFKAARRSIVRLLENDSFARWRSEQRKKTGSKRRAIF